VRFVLFRVSFLLEDFLLAEAFFFFELFRTVFFLVSVLRDFVDFKTFDFLPVVLRDFDAFFFVFFLAAIWRSLARRIDAGKNYGLRHISNEVATGSGLPGFQRKHAGASNI
jgi:hypothetical protein